MNDLTQISDEIKAIGADAESLMASVKVMSVTNTIEAENANEYLVRTKKMVKTVTETKKMILKPIKDSIDSISAMFEPGLKLMSDIESILREKILKYQQEQRRLQFEEEQRKKAEADAILAKQQESAKTVDEEIAIIERREAIEQKEVTLQSTAVKSTEGMSMLRTRWTFDIENADLVPREFCDPSSVKIRKAMNDGARNIPGVKIYQVESLAVR